MMKDEQMAETLVYSFISEYGLREGEQFPDPDIFAVVIGRDMGDAQVAVDAACQAGVLIHAPTGTLIIKSLQAIPGQELQSFGDAAKLHGNQFNTTVSEASLRLPRIDPDDPVATGFDRAAHQALGLNDDEPFIVISRVRLPKSLAGEDPRVIHRAYLNPKRFPQTFLADHDFMHESLIHIYRQYNYSILWRPGAIRPRFACIAERNDLKLELSDAVNDFEQRTIASGPQSQRPFVLEYLRATYRNVVFKFRR